MLIKERLKTLRLQRGITQEELAKIINVTKTTISYYENGKRIPTLQNLIDLSNYFEVTTDYLIGRTETLYNK